MNLIIVTGKAFTIRCKLCGKITMSDNEQFYADTEGEPFKDYYCSDCYPKLNKEKKWNSRRIEEIVNGVQCIRKPCFGCRYLVAIDKESGKIFCYGRKAT